MTKRTDDLKKIKNLYKEDILEQDAKNFENLELALKKYFNNVNMYSHAKQKVNQSYSEVVVSANQFFTTDKFKESLYSIESPKLMEEIQQVLESSSSSTEYLSLDIIINPFDNVNTRIEAEKEIDIINALHVTLKDKYKKPTFGSKFRNFWDDCTNNRRWFYENTERYLFT